MGVLNGPKVNSTNVKKLTCLAASLTLLLGTGCGELVQETQAPSTTIWVAAATGDLAVVQEHGAAGTSLDAREPSGGITPLIAAAAGGYTEVVRLLVESGAKLETRDDNGTTALMVAVFLCHEETVKVLLKSGAEVNVKNNADLTPLDTVSGEWNPDLENAYHVLAAHTFRELNVKRVQTLRPKMAALLRENGGKTADELLTSKAEAALAK
jgi:hypothetical protein